MRAEIPFVPAGAAAARGLGIAANRALGLAAEARAEEQLVAEGAEVLGRHVAARTSVGLRVIDLVVKDAAEEIIAIEVKSGGAVRSAAQVLKDTLMGSEGAVIIGKNAPQSLRNLEVVIRTVVMHMY